MERKIAFKQLQKGNKIIYSTDKENKGMEVLAEVLDKYANGELKVQPLKIIAKNNVKWKLHLDTVIAIGECQPIIIYGNGNTTVVLKNKRSKK